MKLIIAVVIAMVHIKTSGVSGSPPVEGESSTEGCLQRIFSGGEWGPWSMRTECSAIIEQQVKTILTKSGCQVDSEAGTIKAEAGTTDDVDDAMIMSSAGETMELFIPSRNKTCRLPDTTTHRYGHTVDGLLICGGGRSSDNCDSFSNGVWSRTHTTTGRWCATSVKIGTDLYLIGGKQEMTTDIVDMREGGKTREGPALQHSSWWSCAAKNRLQDGFIVTGGYIDDELIEAGVDLVAVGSKRAHQYNLAGFVKDLPDMNVGRTYHGCGSYLRGDGVQVFMVAGGGHGKRGSGIESTEALIGLDAMAWTIMTSLPKPMRLPGMVTLGNKLYLAAGEDEDERKCRDEIYTWNDKNNSWDIVGRRGISDKCVTAGTVAMTPELERYC